MLLLPTALSLRPFDASRASTGSNACPTSRVNRVRSAIAGVRARHLLDERFRQSRQCASGTANIRGARSGMIVDIVESNEEIGLGKPSRANSRLPADSASRVAYPHETNAGNPVDS